MLGVPVAFVINLLPRLIGRDTEEVTAFRVTPTYAIIGLSPLLVLFILGFIILTWSAVPPNVGISRAPRSD